jgi:periplasmic protein CpxP/Spy
MDYFSKNKILISSIVVLAALNIATLATLWWFAGRQNDLPQIAGRSGLRAHEFLVRELRLTDEQQLRYKQMREEHAATTRQLLEQLRNQKKDFFELVRNNNLDEAEIVRKSNAIAQLQSEIDRATLHHFQQIRMMCTEHQRLKFDSVMNEVLRMLGAPPPPRGQQGPPDLPPHDMPPQ